MTPGLMKTEYPGDIIHKFVGLRPKMYAISLYQKDCDVMRAKGVVRAVLNRQFSFVHYEQCLLSRQRVMARQQSIRSFHGQLFTIEEQKIALSADDDKRCVTEDGLDSVPYGHYSLM
jgi:hypothetical protein